MGKHENYATKLASDFKYRFTTEQVVDDVGITLRSAKDKVAKMKRNGEIITPYRSFHVILPPEYRKRGDVPAIQYIDPLMAHLNEHYYIGLLSAAEIHGAAHQKPQVLQIMVKKRRREIKCGRSLIRFIVRGDMDRMPYMKLNTEKGKVNVSTPELTAFELVGHHKNSAGMSNVATILMEMADKISAIKLKKTSESQPVAWVQKLGYLLDFIGENDLSNAILPIVRKRAFNWAPLIRSMSVKDGKRNEKWCLIVNSELEPDCV